MDVNGKVALVTGAARGIGKAISIQLAKEGAQVIATDINEDDLGETYDELIGVGNKCLILKLDVTNQDSVDSAVKNIIDEFSSIDILVNNAGTIGARGWEERDVPDESDWDAIYAVNLKGMVKITEAVIPTMKSNRRGKIINMSSITGRLGTVTSPPYGVSKAGVINLTQAWALEFAEFSINVNAICPGLLWTPMWQRIANRWSLDEEKWKGYTPREIFDATIKDRIPLQREQTPEDIACAVAFLASDYAHNITGQALNVNGGSHMN